MVYKIPKDMILFLSLLEEWLNENQIVYSYKQEKPKSKNRFRYTFRNECFIVITPDSVETADCKFSVVNESQEKMEWIKAQITEYHKNEKATTDE